MTCQVFTLLLFKKIAKKNIYWFLFSMQLLSVKNYTNYHYQQSFRGYTAQQICADLCKGACCNHGTAMNSTLKKITDKICAHYRTIPDNMKSAVLIKTPIVKWIVNSKNPDVISLNNLANTYIDAISKETDINIINKLEAKLSELNTKLSEILGVDETFCAVTNPELLNASNDDIVTADNNICMYKDHDKTNLCSIYNGVKDENGDIIERPNACFSVGSSEMPCPWHNPEKYAEICSKTAALFASKGYGLLPPQIIQQYVARQFNLNEVFVEKIWKPYINKLDTII